MKRDDQSFSVMVAEIALEVVGITKAFGSLVVADGVDLTIPAGERRGLIGVNGAGKTTLFNMIAGELRPDRGDIYYFGERITRESVMARTLRGLGRTYQVSTLVPSLTVRANLALARGNGRLPSLVRPWRAAADDPLVIEAARRLGLTDMLDEHVSNLSHGVLRQLELAMVLARGPKLLLLDEPAAGLSRAERRILAVIIRDLPRAVTLVMIEHDMDMVLDLSDRISVLHSGRIMATGTPGEISRHQGVRDIYLGRAHG